LKHIEGQFKFIRDTPKRLFDDADKWIKNAKVQLDKFTENSNDPNYIAFEMLEEKTPGKGGGDVIATGEKILLQLDGQKDVTLPKINGLVD